MGETGLGPETPTESDAPDESAGGESGAIVSDRDLRARLRGWARPAWGRKPWARRTGRVLLVLLVGLGGGAVGSALSPPTTAYVGPLEIAVRVQPSVDPGIRAEIPPVGLIAFDTYDAPLAVTAQVRSVDVEIAERLLGSPQAVLALQVGAPEALQQAVIRAVLTTAGCTLAGALIAGFVVYRRPWRTLQSGAVALVVLLGTGGLAAATFDSDGLASPTFTGPLSRAPYIASQTGGLVDRLESYRSGLADLVTSVTTLYAVSENLPVLPATSGDGELVTALHISDIHLNPLGFDVAERLVDQFGADLVIDTGDITTWGTSQESGTVTRVGDMGVPYLFVRGNHDSQATQQAVAAQQGAIVLDDDVVTIDGLTFAGIGDPRFSPDAGEGTGTDADRDELEESMRELADTIETHNAGAPSTPVDVALVHDQSRVEPLLGQVPLVLAGHLHSRSVRVDESGTQVMVQGSTGGAGVSAGGFQRLADGDPLELTATLLYFDTQGDRAGRLVAYDEVTVGGLGLASVSLQRTVIRPEDVAASDGEGPPVRSPGAVPTDDATTGTAPTPAPVPSATVSTGPPTPTQVP